MCLLASVSACLCLSVCVCVSMCVCVCKLHLSAIDVACCLWHMRVPAAAAAAPNSNNFNYVTHTPRWTLGHSSAQMKRNLPCSSSFSLLLSFFLEHSLRTKRKYSFEILCTGDLNGNGLSLRLDQINVGIILYIYLYYML